MSSRLGIINDMAREKQSPEILSEISKHLYYEYSMFVTLAQVMASGGLGKSTLNNAALESFTVHTRALLDFFYNEQPRADDVVADDFFEDHLKWITIRLKKTELLQSVHERVGKEIAHLTYKRLLISEEEKQWYFLDILGDINALIGIFLLSIKRDYLDSLWDSILDQLLSKN
jgi:hypothetical protein